MTFEDLAPERRERLKVSILNSLASAVSALEAPPVAACLAQAKAFGGPHGDCTLIGGGAANVVYAAFYNTALVRYVDFMDSYLSATQLCHPSDNMAAVLAACERAGRSGKEFLTALAVAYQVEVDVAHRRRPHSWTEGSISRHRSLTRWALASPKRSAWTKRRRRPPWKSAVRRATAAQSRAPRQSRNGKGCPRRKWRWDASTRSSWRRAAWLGRSM